MDQFADAITVLGVYTAPYGSIGDLYRGCLSLLDDFNSSPSTVGRLKT